MTIGLGTCKGTAPGLTSLQRPKHLAIQTPSNSQTHSTVCQVCSEVEGGTRRMLHGILTPYTLHSMVSKLEAIFVFDCLAATAAART